MDQNEIDELLESSDDDASKKSKLKNGKKEQDALEEEYGEEFEEEVEVG